MKYLILLISIIIALSACKNKTDMTYYTYKLNCNNCNIAFANPNGSIEERTNITGPWSYDFNGEKGNRAYFKATANYTNATISIELVRGNKVYKHATSYGDYVTATIDIIIPSKHKDTDF
jgi:hypothetical protein